MTSLDPSREILERSLLKLFWASLDFPSPAINKLINVFACAILILILAYSEASEMYSLDYEIKQLNQFSSEMISFTSQTLGFLIAGFTVFVTFSDKKLFNALKEKIMNGTDATWFRYIFLSFVHVFSVFFFFLCYCFFLKFLFYLTGDTATNPGVKLAISPLTFVFFIGALNCLLCLKSFIYNVFQTCLMSIKFPEN